MYDMKENSIHVKDLQKLDLLYAERDKGNSLSWLTKMADCKSGVLIRAHMNDQNDNID